MMIVLGVLPAIAFVLWIGVMLRASATGQKNEAPVRRAIMTVAPLWAAWLVAGTELLGALNAINRTMLIAWWIVPLPAAIALLWRRPSPRARLRPAPRWTIMDALLLAALLALLIACGLPAALAPPMNVDSLTYHLPRQVIWAQQHNVADFSTNDVRQIMMAPYAEFVGLHLMVLTGGDALHDLIQWFALILAVAAVSLIARRLGAKRSGQLLAAIIAATVPNAFLEASNTKNDVIEAMWVVIAAYWMWTFLDRAKGLLPRAALLGLAIGAAVLTKGTGIFFVAPLALVAAIALVRHARSRAIVPLLVLAAAALALNAGYFSRNYRQFGKIAGPETKAEGGYELINALQTPPAIASSLVRNVAIEAGTPWLSVNAAMNAAVHELYRWLGIDPQDPRLTFHGLPYTGVGYHPHDEDRAGSPAHLLLAILSLPMALLMTRRIRFGRVMLLLGLAAIGFIIFCTLLRWQPWNTRLLIPVFCLIAPALGAIWTARGITGLAPCVAAALIACLMPTIMLNPRPLFGPHSIFITPRFASRFSITSEDIIAFQNATRLIVARHPHCVAFDTGGNSPDYLVMRALLDKLHPAPTFEYILPRTKVVGGKEELPPDVIIAGPETTAITDPVTLRSFTRVQRTRSFSILTPAPHTPP